MLPSLVSAALGINGVSTFSQIDISTRVAAWTGIPNLDNPWPSYPAIPAGPAGWLGQGSDPVTCFAPPAGTVCPTYQSLNADNQPYVPCCAAGCVVWEAQLTVNIPANQGHCGTIEGWVAADDNIAFRVTNSRFPSGTYILGGPSSGVGRWDIITEIPSAGQLDPVTGMGFFADGVNTLTLRIDNRVTCLMIAAYVNAHIDMAACATHPPPPPPAPVIVAFDPHLFFHHGGRADFRGLNNTWYNLLSTADASVNVLFTAADFNLIRPKKQLVHGSRMQALTATFKTSAGQTIVVEYNATTHHLHRASLGALPAPGVLAKDGKPKELGYVLSTVEPSKPGWGAASMAYHRSKTIDNVRIYMQRKQTAGMMSTALIIDNGKWEITSQSLPFPNPRAHPGKALLNVKVAPKEGYDPEKDAVAPHGLIGQSYDGDDVGVDGAVDDYSAAEVTTAAMAEGAIEGAAADYQMANKYAVDFKYSRFGKAAAKPRDVSKLSGARVGHDLGKQRAIAHGGAGSSADVAPTVEDLRDAMTMERA